jgi:pimeloyl-ACP methyl ester carboxylesterase
VQNKKIMKKVFAWVFLLGCLPTYLFAQNYTPKIEPCPCMTKLDPRLTSVCGYLVVPENRQKPKGRTVKIPFVFARQPQQSATKNLILSTTGGPGYSTIANVDSIAFDSPYFRNGGVLLFDQRGTKKTIPCLDCEGIDAAIKRSYRENLSQDSLVGLAVKTCRNKFTAQGIDLSAYTTIESAADINDLRKVLKIDSLTLAGNSYSGGLMMTVARNHPEGIKSIIMDSPLPSFVNYEEHALSNHNDALNRIFENLEADSVKNALFPNLKQRFQTYFTEITGKKFTILYTEKGNQTPLSIRYSKNELLEAVIDRLNGDEYETLPSVINDLVAGKHEAYIKRVLDNKFSGDKYLSYGMRLSVYCSEQMAYSDIKLVKKQDDIFPWFSGYPFNNLNHAICACWDVKPESAIAKTPLYSTIPMLITSGDIDPWCGTFYNRLIKRTVPNSQLLIFKNRAHGTGYRAEGIDFLNNFIENPYKKLVSPTKDVIVE